MSSHKKAKTGINRIYHAFLNSINGIKIAWVEEQAFRQICILSIIFIPLGLYIGSSWVIKILLIFPIFISIIVELINSAIENAVDYTSTDIHPLAKKAKDMGSAIQLLSLIFWALIWISYILVICLK